MEENDLFLFLRSNRIWLLAVRVGLRVRGYRPAALRDRGVNMCVLTLTAGVPVGPAGSPSAPPVHPETSAASCSGYETHRAGKTNPRRVKIEPANHTELSTLFSNVLS